MTENALVPEKANPPKKRLGSVRDVEAITSMDRSAVLRYADSGRMPWGMKIGALRRWDLGEIEAWIAGGCKPVRTVKPKGGA
jgi:predicted DNA-binding transcriptional regulator AlpA